MDFLSQINNTLFVALCFGVFTVILTVVVFICRLLKNTPMLVTFNQRMMTLWVLILLFIPAFIGGKLVSCLFFATISMIAVMEYYKMSVCTNPDKLKNPLIVVFLVLQYVALYMDIHLLFVVLIPLSIFLFVPFVGIFYPDNKEIWKECVSDYIGLMLTVYAMSYMCAFLTVPQMQHHNGQGLLLFVLILTLMSDFFQAICGFLWGRHFLAPNLSPHKTWEGLIGGGVLTAGLSWMMGIYLTPLHTVALLGLGFILNIAAFCGDVTISAIKRYAGVKDCSCLLPGHGGLLDRFDSILFTAPILFWYAMWGF